MSDKAAMFAGAEAASTTAGLKTSFSLLSQPFDTPPMPSRKQHKKGFR